MVFIKNSIPDIVVYINGLPLAIIEAKSPKVSITDAISDLSLLSRKFSKAFLL